MSYDDVPKAEPDKVDIDSIKSDMPAVLVLNERGQRHMQAEAVLDSGSGVLCKLETVAVKLGSRVEGTRMVFPI